MEIEVKRRILLVDDDAVVLLSLKAVLETCGFEVETAASAIEATAKLAASRFHMVITDMRMEHEHSGVEVIQKARAMDYDPAIAILTAYPDLGSEWESKGAHRLLVKPIETEILLRQIEVLLIQHEDAKQRRMAKAKGAALRFGDSPVVG